MTLGRIPTKQVGTFSSYLTEGAALFPSFTGVTTPGTPQNIILYNVAALKKNYLLLFFISCRQRGVFKIFVDSILIGSGRTGAGVPNDGFAWCPYYLATTGQAVKVEFTADAGGPATDIEAFLQARNVTA